MSTNTFLYGSTTDARFHSLGKFGKCGLRSGMNLELSTATSLSPAIMRSFAQSQQGIKSGI